MQQPVITGVALDVRGTLITPPRHRNLSRALATVLGAAEHDEPDLLAAERAAAKEVGTLAVERPELVLDSTYSTVECFLRSLSSDRIRYSPRHVQLVYTVIREEYVALSTPLIDDGRLNDELLRLAGQGIVCAIAADGPVDREAEVLASCYPIASASLGFVYSSSIAGCNKHSVRYFDGLSRTFGRAPESLLMIGDRIDKDLNTASSAGYQTALVSREGAAAWPRSFVNVLEALRSI